MQSSLVRVVLVLVIAVLTTGCGQQPQPPVVAQQPAPQAPAALPSTPPPGTPGAFPPPVGGTGQGAPPPTGVLPPPKELATEIERIRAKFGLISILGSGTNAAQLQGLETSLARFPAPQYAKLQLVFEPIANTPYKGIDAAGLWNATGPDGKDMQGASTEPAVAGRIYYFDAQPSVKIMVHEIAHHATLFADGAMGERLLQSMGYTMTNANGAQTPGDRVNGGDWNAAAVALATRPTEYSKTNHAEHIAEVVTTDRCARAEFDAVGTPILATFACPAATRTALAQSLGATIGDAMR